MMPASLPSTPHFFYIHLTRYANVIVKISSAIPMLDDETALGSDIMMSKTRHFAAGLENLAH
ncbi:hypothetical protein M441DRAFT_453806, partial [Trichoderma asperellum CBS 433.97]